MAYSKAEKVGEEFQTLVTREIETAIKYVESDIAPDRAKAVSYYKGDPLGNEEEGRSQVVMTPVRDTVLGILPALMRIFFGGERVVEFEPTSQEKIPVAKQITDFVNHIIRVDNPGYMILMAVFKDALIKKLGLIKWWWEDKESLKSVEYAGLTDDDMLQKIIDGWDVEITKKNEDGTFDVKATKKMSIGRARFMGVPGEEIIVSRDARSLDDATLVGHMRELPLAELVSMGYDKDELEEHIQQEDSSLDHDPEALERNSSDGTMASATSDEMMKPVLYCEAYLRTNVGTDEEPCVGIKKLCCVGKQFHILREEVVDDRPFADFCPDPEPHTLIGGSMADRTMDLQRIESAILRNVLDSLAQSIHPATEVVEGQVNMVDVLNKEMGRVVRVRAPGMMREVGTTFTGKEALPVLEMINQIKESRTGVSRGAGTIDADVFQSTEKAAAAASLAATQQQTEMIARTFAEGGMKRLMRGLYKLVLQHQSEERIVRLRGSFVPMNPAQWDADLDVTVNAALGNGNVQERAMVLQGVLADQKEVLSTLGPDNPLCSLQQYRETVTRILEIYGFHDSSLFYKEIPPDWKPAPPSPQPQGDPAAMMLAQVEAQKAQDQAKAKEAELNLKAQQQQIDAQLAHAKAEQEIRIAHEKAGADIQIQREKIAADLSIAEKRLAQEKEIATMQLSVDREIRASQVEVQRTAARSKSDGKK